MSQTIKTLALIGALLSLIFLAACGSATPTSAPTTDLNSLRTEVAATVFAQVTQDLALTPSATVPPTPTATLPPTSTPTLAPTTLPTEATGATATLTSSTPVIDTANKAEWVSQSVADNTTFAPGETFSMTWRIKNVGTTTWTAQYMLRFYSGDAFGVPKEVPLNREVLPGDIVDITLQMKAPTTPGTYSSVWVMATSNRSNFKEPVYLQIIVALPPTASPTPKP